MVTIAGGDLVLTDGTRLHIKNAEKGVVQYWAQDTNMTHRESREDFMERAVQAGRIKILPGEGKFDNEVPDGGREEFVKVF